LPSAANRAKANWNSSHYVQIKVSVYPEVADAFKAACAAAGGSMAGVLSRYMAEYSAAPKSQNANTKAATVDLVSTKKKRGNTVRGLVQTLALVRDAEEQAMENTPENLRGAGNYEASEERVCSMDEALDILENLY